ncbi:MAG: fimbrillin family protein [Bacteroidales bacterium]|nr:fimbrillin family protein [Bacteroidales bacterium]
MKRPVLFLIAVAAMLAGCSKSAEVQMSVVGDVNRPVQFTVSNIMTLDTKADAIGDGKYVAIYAGTPISTENVKMTVSMEAEASNGTLAPTVPNSLLWAVGQTTAATNFFAVYPWEETRPVVKPGDTEEEKAVEANWYIDYSIDDTAASVDYADKFLSAAASQAPGTETTPATVALAFKHPFAKLVYNVTNTSDDFVKGLKVSGIRQTGKVMFTTGAVTTTGEAIAADDAVSLVANGENSWMTVVMPEASAVNPRVVVEMVSGAEYVFTLATPIALSAGKVYTATITITGTHGTDVSDRTVLGTFSVSDWEAVDSGALTGGVTTQAAKWWYIVGNIDEVSGTTDSNWSKNIPFKCTGEYSWEVSFYYAGTTDASNGFKIRYASDAVDWTDAWSKDLVIDAAAVKAEGEEDPYLVTGNAQGVNNTRINTVGKYKIVFYPNTHDYHIYKINN